MTPGLSLLWMRARTRARRASGPNTPSAGMRRVILALVGHRWCSAELAKHLGVTQPAICRQLHLLRDYGLAEESHRVGNGHGGRAKIYYRLTANGLLVARAIRMELSDRPVSVSA